MRCEEADPAHVTRRVVQRRLRPLTPASGCVSARPDGTRAWAPACGSKPGRTLAHLGSLSLQLTRHPRHRPHVLSLITLHPESNEAAECLSKGT